MKQLLFILAVLYSYACPQIGWAQLSDVERNHKIDQIFDLVEAGDKLNSENKHRDAIKPYQAALALCQEVYQTHHEVHANVLNRLGITWHMLGDLKTARKMHEQTLEMRRKLRGNQHLEVANSLNQLARVLLDQGDFDKSKQLFLESVQIKQANLGVDSPEVALAYNNLGALERRQGNYRQAREYLQQGLKIAESKLGNEHEVTLASLNNLGELELEFGNLSVARQLFEKVLSIAEKLYKTNDGRLAIIHNNLGEVLKEQGQTAAALKAMEKSLKIQQQTFGETHPDVATSLNNIAVLLQQNRDFQGAAKKYEAALKILQPKLGNEHPLTIDTFQNLGSVQLLLDQMDDSRKNLDKALSLQKKVLGEQHPHTAITHFHLALIDIKQGKYELAQSKFEQVLKTQQQIYGEEHPDSVRTRLGLARTAAVLGNHEAALQQYDQARRHIKPYIGRTLSGLADQEQLRFMEHEDERALHEAIGYGYQQREHQTSINHAAEWLINGKALTFSVLAERALIARDSKNPELVKLTSKLEQTRHQLNKLSLLQPTKNELTQYRDTLRQLSSEEQRLSREINSNKGVAGSGKFRWVQLSEIRKALPKESILLDITQVRPTILSPKLGQSNTSAARYIAFVIPPHDQGEVTLIDLGDVKQIDKLIAAIRAQLQKPPQAETDSKEVFSPELIELGNLIHKPLSQVISAETKELIICPDGDTWTFPWSLLPIDKEHFLLEQFSLRYLPHSRLVLNKPRQISNTTAPVIFSDPDFDLTADAVRQSIQAIFPKTIVNQNMTTRSASLKSSLPKVSRLPNTKIEADAVLPNLQKFASQKPVNYTGKYALETVFKNLERPEYVLLSTHGYFLPAKENANATENLALTQSRFIKPSTNPADHPLLRSGILLSGCNNTQSNNEDDGILSSLEILGLDLRGNRLVVLSACETGLGQVQVGQGIAGLRQAFQIAGAQSVAATLWQVPDRETAVLVNNFFDQLAAEKAPAEALRQAQLKLLQSRRDRYGASQPFYWAAWTLTGN